MKIDDDQVPNVDREMIEEMEKFPDLLKKFSDGPMVAGAKPAFISASLTFDGTLQHLSGWITYLFEEVKIQFVATKFTSKLGNWSGSGAFPTIALSREDLAGKTGTFSSSGARETSLLWLWLGDTAVCVPLGLLGAGAGHLVKGEVQFRART